MRKSKINHFETQITPRIEKIIAELVTLKKHISANSILWEKDEKRVQVAIDNLARIHTNGVLTINQENLYIALSAFENHQYPNNWDNLIYARFKPQHSEHNLIEYLTEKIRDNIEFSQYSARYKGIQIYHAGTQFDYKGGRPGTDWRVGIIETKNNDGTPFEHGKREWLLRQSYREDQTIVADTEDEALTEVVKMVTLEIEQFLATKEALDKHMRVMERVLITEKGFNLYYEMLFDCFTAKLAYLGHQIRESEYSDKQETIKETYEYQDYHQGINPEFDW